MQKRKLAVASTFYVPISVKLLSGRVKQRRLYGTSCH